MPRFHRRRRFGTPSRAAVTRSDIPMPKTKSRRKCAACHQVLKVGDPAVRLRLKKSHQHPCSSCGHKPAKLKFFHAACTPTDIDKAMGYDPNAHAATHATPANAGGAVPPPPKPQTADELKLVALLAVEAAMKRRMAEDPKLRQNKELEAAYKTYDGCKSRALRPGTPQEGVVAMKMALKRCLDLIF